jgi:hypothetical protein
MGYGDGQGVGGVWAGDRSAGKQPLDHGVDLRLVGIADAHDRFLDQAGGIFAYLYSRAGGDHENNAAGLAELEGRLRVLVDEHLLDRGGVGRMIGEDRFKLRGEVGEAHRKRFASGCFQLPIGDVRQAIALGANEAPAGRAKSRVEAEDQCQPSFSSSSSLIS